MFEQVRPVPSYVPFVFPWYASNFTSLRPFTWSFFPPPAAVESVPLAVATERWHFSQP